MAETTESSGDSTLGVTFSINTDEFVSQLYISVPVGIILMVLYCIVRKISPNTWEVRRKYAEMLIEEEEQEEDDPFEESQSNLPKLTKNITHPHVRTGFLNWMKDVWTMDTNEFYRHAGFDALVFKLYLQGCMYICLGSLPYALCVLLPVYATSENPDESTDILSILSINTVGVGSKRLWAAVVGMFIFTAIALYYLSKVYLAIAYATDQFLVGSDNILEMSKLSWFNYNEMINNIVEVNVNLVRAPIDFVGDNVSKVKGYVVKKELVRQPSEQSDHSQHDDNDNKQPEDVEEDEKEQKMAQDEEKTELLSDQEFPSDARSIELNDMNGKSIPMIDRYTIMIRDLPKPFRDEQTLKQFMDRLFPGKIAKVVIIPDVRELSRIQTEIKFHAKALKKLSDKHEFDLDDVYDDTIMPEILEGTKCCGCCGEQINLITYHRTNKDALVSKFNKMKRDGLTCTPTAFVTFNCLKAASIAISCPIRFGVSTLKMEKAPYPNDLYWDNLKYTSRDLIPYNLLVTIAMFFLLIFWSIPVAAIQGLANLETIFRAFNANVYDYFDETTVSWMQGSLTVLILDLWLMLIPVIVTLLTKIQRKAYRGRLEQLVLTKYYDCLVFMVLLVTVITGTTVSNADNFSDYAQNIVSSMGTIVNSLADGLSNMSIYFLLYVLLNTFIWLPLELYRPAYYFAVKFGLPEPNRFNYAIWFAKTMLILTIVLTYAVMNPIMWVLGLTYFVFANFVFTYNLSMSWVPEFETGAKQWPQVFGRIRFGFMIAIFTLIGFMALRQAYICGAILLPLAAFIWHLTGQLQTKFRPIFRAPSLTSATDKDNQIDKLMQRKNVNNLQQFDEFKSLNAAYLPPIMGINYPSYNERVKKVKERQGKNKKKRKKSKDKNRNNRDESDDNRLSIGGAGDSNDDNVDIQDEYDRYQNV